MAGKSRIKLLWEGIFVSKLSLLGAGVTTISAALLIVFLAAEWLGDVTGPYHGLVTYLILPGFFVGGLLLIPFGVWLAYRKAGTLGDGSRDVKPLIIDLSKSSHRQFWGIVVVLTFVNFVLISVVSYEAYHYTESTEFCGTLCHSVMEPEYEAYKRSPHARIGCVECHIGSGASWFVKSKLSGLRQVYGVLADDFSKPIPTPVHNLRPARETCEQCHWPEFFHGNRIKIFKDAGADDTPTDPVVTALLLHVGGRSEKTKKYQGIHWHVSRDNTVQYRALDYERTKIPEVRVIGPDGKQTLYVNEGMDAPAPDAPWRTMDCIDCHNRPTHIYERADEAVDRLILEEGVSVTLPDMRQAGIAAITKDYPTKDAARAGIRDALLAYYKEKHSDFDYAKKKEIARYAEALFEQAYAKNIYPRLNITWGTYPSHLGHQNETGCFRCHDESHESPDGGTISQDCSNCHTFLVEEERESAIDEEMKKYIYLYPEE